MSGNIWFTTLWVQCKVVADNRAISVPLNCTKSPSARWSIKLSTYPNVTLIHRNGYRHGDADSISRFPFHEIKLSDHNWSGPVTDAAEDILALNDHNNGLPWITHREFYKLQYNVAEWQYIIDYIQNDLLSNNNQLAKKIVLEAPHYEIYQGVLCRLFYPRKRATHHFVRQIWIPSSVQESLIENLHSIACSWRCSLRLWSNIFLIIIVLLLERYVRSDLYLMQSYPKCQMRKGRENANQEMLLFPPNHEICSCI